MLVNASRLLGYPILSLHMSGKIAEIAELIVDPDNLKIIAFKLVGPEIGDGEVGDILKASDAREFSNFGIVVDSADEFVVEGDVIKIDKVLALNFEMVGLRVETKKGTRLGKVSSFIVNTENFSIQQIVVQRPFLKAFSDPELLIGRSEIKEITDDKIIVKDEEAKIRENAMKKDFVPNFVNPFRNSEPRLSTADNQSLDESNTE